MKNDFLFSSNTSARRIDLAGLILRLLVASSMLYGHGLGKFQKLISGETIEFVNLFGIGTKITFIGVMFGEFICAALVVVGLFTRLALLPLIIIMTYVIFIIHADDPFRSKEVPILYLAAFMALFLIGSGRYSLDRLIRSRKSTV